MPTAAVSTPVDEVTDMAELRIADRCDRCGAQAFVRVRIPRAGVLDFCRHHFEEQEAGLIDVEAVILADHRDRLKAKPAF